MFPDPIVRVLYLTIWVVVCYTVVEGLKKLNYQKSKEQLLDEQQQHEPKDIQGVLLNRRLVLLDLLTLEQHNITGNITPSIVIPSCEAYLQTFSEQASSFVHCSVEYARPFRFCEGCVKPYKRASSLYEELSQKGSADCKLQLLNSDRVNILTRTYNYMQDLWSTADCPSCFKSDSISEDQDGMVHYELENNTRIFLELYNETATCMNISFEILVNPCLQNKLHNFSVCQDCQGSYGRLNQHFNSILKLSLDHVCMDVVDIMNSTRQVWSGHFNCSHRTGDVAPILLLTTAFCLCPVLFYVGNRVHGEADANRQILVKQKRLSKFRSRRSYGSVSAVEIDIPPPTSPVTM